jgi:glycosyltransferase involved in cell wall biosynthesis
VIVGQCAAKLVSTDDKGQLDRAIEEAGIAHDVLRLGYVRDEDVGALYRDALAFVFPSLFEGFGMPAVEALGFGLPVITTRCAALPETTLGFARYVKDPLDAEELADTLVRVASCPAENRPSAEQVAAIRDAYNPVAVASRYRAMIGEVAL